MTRLGHFAHTQRASIVGSLGVKLLRKTPAQRHIVTRGGQLRSVCSALGMPSVVLDFAMGRRCQVADSSLHAGGVMRLGISTWLATLEACNCECGESIRLMPHQGAQPTSPSLDVDQCWVVRRPYVDGGGERLVAWSHAPHAKGRRR